jgi:hypothetical protein
MLVTIHYSPELAVWKLHNGSVEKIVLAEDFAPGARLEPLAPLFAEAKQAVESGRAVCGVHVEV